MSTLKETQVAKPFPTATPPALRPSGFTFRSFARTTFVAYGILPILLVLLLVGFAIVEPRFLSPGNIVNVMRQVSFLGIIAIGQMMYLVTKNYDLSNGGTVALSSVVCAMVLSQADAPPLVGVLAGLLVGLVVGTINGVLIAVFKISSFMVTLGTGSAAVGVALMLTGGIPITGLPQSFTKAYGSSMVMGLPFSTFVMLLVLAGTYVLFNWTRLGRRAFAVGGNEHAAHHAGVNVRSTLLKLMITGSLLAALVGVLMTARISSGEANIGLQFPMQSIIAAVIGGIALNGGEGRVSGAFMGALFIILLSNGMDLIRVQSYVQDILLGALLVLALMVDRLRTRVRLTADPTPRRRLR